MIDGMYGMENGKRYIPAPVVPPARDEESRVGD
jgi:hypothetical protein